MPEQDKIDLILDKISQVDAKVSKLEEKTATKDELKAYIGQHDETRRQVKAQWTDIKKEGISVAVLQNEVSNIKLNIRIVWTVFVGSVATIAVIYNIIK